MKTEYAHYIKRKWLALAVLCAAMLCAALLSLSVGAASLPLVEILLVLIGGGEDASHIIIFNVRIPRIVTAVSVGFALAMSGCIMQNVLRNPLASASTLGISQGASFGAAVAIVYFEAGVHVVSGASVTAASPFTVTIFAFIGGISTTILILFLSYRSGANPAAMILAGVAIGAMFMGATALVQYFADDIRVGSIVYWTFGNLGRPGWREIQIMTALNITGFLYFLFNRWNYNAMESGAHTAKSLGVNVDMLILVGMTVSTLISATAIAFVGTINFIGLIAPHIVRKFVGNDYRFLIPCSAFMGATIMIVADIASRMIAAPAVLPIGALTSFLGAPLFLYMIIKKGNMAK
ncbi:MAG: iron ABC transporter permease [Defluviitaleaceae bacterium]|nr:iron ABC transporter permease [Defluviitaleaceae bacterium]